ncbi:hypothetical protein AB0B28_06345 [Glycomyces sp. NPDC046736]|uniref:hypothetical protein n=1 Tax=Glycomyces sp. NPDC046736 TaxID=3155615 RepID=UPI0033DCFCE3
MARPQRPPLKPGVVYGEFANASGTVFVLRASRSGLRMAVCLHHDEGPQIAVVCNPTDASRRFIRWQSQLWSSNPKDWKDELKALAFAAIDTGLCSAPNSVGMP